MPVTLPVRLSDPDPDPVWEHRKIMRRIRISAVCGTLLGAAISPGALAAQGFGIYEHGTCAMGRAGAGVAAPCDDGSAIFFNPAAIAFTSGQRLSAGGTLFDLGADFTNENTGLVSTMDNLLIPLPHVFYTAALGDRLAAGIGLFMPYGLETRWPTTAEGRFIAYKTRLIGFYLQPTAAVKVTDRIAVGAGVDVSFVSLELRQRLDLSEVETTTPGVTFGNLGIAPGTDFADAKLSGNATGVGFHVGLRIKATDRISFGARYLSRQRIDIDDGEADITQIPTGLTLAPGNPIEPAQPVPVDALLAPNFAAGSLTDQSASTSLRFPDQLVLGTAVQVTPELQLLFDYQWTHWAVFDELVLDFEKLPTRVLRQDFRSTSGLRIGGEYALTGTTALRAGFLTHGAAVPDQSVTPRLPEGARTEVTVGLGTRVSRLLHVDAAYQYIDQADRRGRSTDAGVEVPTAAANNGLYRSTAHLFGLTIMLGF